MILVTYKLWLQPVFTTHCVDGHLDLLIQSLITLHFKACRYWWNCCNVTPGCHDLSTDRPVYISMYLFHRNLVCQLGWAHGTHSVSSRLPAPPGRYVPAWTCCSLGSTATSTARTAATSRPTWTSPSMDPSTQPARQSSTRSSSDTEPCWKATWKKVPKFYW